MSTPQNEHATPTPAAGELPLDDFWWNARCVWALEDLMNSEAYRAATGGEGAPPCL